MVINLIEGDNGSSKSANLELVEVSKICLLKFPTSYLKSGRCRLLLLLALTTSYQLCYSGIRETSSMVSFFLDYIAEGYASFVPNGLLTRLRI